MSSTHRRSQAGLSLIEVAIASALLLVMVLGLLPLFYQSGVNNAMGADSTQISNISKSRVEEFSQMPFDAPQLTVANGSTALTVIDYWDPAHEVFTTTAPTGGIPIRFQRTTTIRQFAMSDLLADGNLDTPLDGSADASTVQLKEITVTVESYLQGTESGSGALRGRRILVRALKTI